MKKLSLNWGILSDYRNIIMGISIVFIILFHYYEDLVIFNRPINIFIKLFSYGNLGVDVFLFVSGIGLYFSYKKNNNKLIFYKKRFKRIIIPYILISTPFWIWKDIFLENNFNMLIKDISFISFFSQGNRQLWFILLILSLYAVFPYIYEFIYRNDENEKLIIFNFVLLLCLSIFISTLIYCINSSLYKNIEIALTRIPAFLIGCFCGRYVYYKKKLNINILLASYIGLIVFKLLLRVIGYSDISQILSRYFGVWLGLVACITVAIILYLLKSESINKFFGFFGNFTLELYMTHVLIRTIFNYYGFNYSINGIYIFRSGIQNYTIVIVLSIILSIILNKVYKKYFNKTLKKSN